MAEHEDGPIHDVHHAGEKAKGHLTKKIGPLPLWAWISLGTGGALVLVLIYRSNHNNSTSSTATPDTTTVGDAQDAIDSGAYSDPNGGVGDATYADQPALDDTYPDDGTGLTITLTGGGAPDDTLPTTNDAATTPAGVKLSTQKAAASAAAKKSAQALLNAQHKTASKAVTLGAAPTHTAAVHAQAHSTAFGLAVGPSGSAVAKGILTGAQKADARANVISQKAIAAAPANIRSEVQASHDANVAAQKAREKADAARAKAEQDKKNAAIRTAAKRKR